MVRQLGLVLLQRFHWFHDQTLFQSSLSLLDFPYFWHLSQCTAANGNTPKVFRRKILQKKKVALVGCGIAPTKQTKVPIIQSQVQVQVCTSSFLQRVVFASPSSARRFSQDKRDKKPKRKASFSVDNSHCRLLWSAHESRLWLPRDLPATF